MEKLKNDNAKVIAHDYGFRRCYILFEYPDGRYGVVGNKDAKIGQELLCSFEEQLQKNRTEEEE